MHTTAAGHVEYTVHTPGGRRSRKLHRTVTDSRDSSRATMRVLSSTEIPNKVGHDIEYGIREIPHHSHRLNPEHEWRRKGRQTIIGRLSF